MNDIIGESSGNGSRGPMPTVQSAHGIHCPLDGSLAFPDATLGVRSGEEQKATPKELQMVFVLPWQQKPDEVNRLILDWLVQRG